MNRCDSKESELEDAKNKAHSSKIKLDSKQKELGKLVEKEKTVQADFLGLIGENNKFQDYLTKESVLSSPTPFRPRKVTSMLILSAKSMIKPPKGVQKEN